MGVDVRSVAAQWSCPQLHLHYVAFVPGLWTSSLSLGCDLCVIGALPYIFVRCKQSSTKQPHSNLLIRSLQHRYGCGLICI